MPMISPSLFIDCFCWVYSKFFPHGWCRPSYWTLHSMNRDVAPFCAVSWQRTDSINASLLHLLQYVVLANRNFQCTSLRSIVASLTLFCGVEDRLVLVLFQRNSVTHVLKEGLLWGSHCMLPKGCVKRKEQKWQRAFPWLVFHIS